MYLVGNTTDAAVPKVFSTSYGECEGTVGYDYMMRINTEFMKAGARGLTLTFASGDSGVGSDSGSCTRYLPSSLVRAVTVLSFFAPRRFCGQWPAGSPYVTGVGGTTSDSPEVSWGGSSGGFADRFDIAGAPWQAAAVAQYFKVAKNLPTKSRYNATGRGFPDVAAQSTNFEIISDGRTEGVAGTSCACPTFSGIVGLLNDLRAAKGKGSLGFLNPMLYKNAGGFVDITSGHNPGCGTEGFEAAAGWDPVTGLGTPDYTKLAAIVEALP